MNRFAVIALLAASAAQGQSAPACPAKPPAGAPPVSLFTYDQRAALDVRDSLASAEHGVDVHRVSFVSPKGGRATALLHVPHDSVRAAKGKLPGIVMLHGAPGDAWGMGGVAVPVAITCGRAEENRHNNREMAHALRSQGYPVTIAEVPDAHNFTAWRDALDPHLTDLLRRVWG